MTYWTPAALPWWQAVPQPHEYVVCKEQSLGAYTLCCARVFDDTPDMLFIEVSNHTPVIRNTQHLMGIQTISSILVYVVYVLK